MRVSCTTCLELLTPSAEISCAPCGHVFHMPCILQWLETGKANCPQCRAKCRENQLRRVYFNEAMDATLSQDSEGSDSSALQNKIDSLVFDLRMANTEKKKLKEEKDSLAAQKVALRDEVRKAETQRNSEREEKQCLKTQMRYMEADRVKAKKAKEEADELRERLDLYKAVDDMVRGSMGEVNSRLHEMGDFSKTARELSVIIVGLKRELMAQGDERATLRAEMKQKAGKMYELRQQLSKATRESSDLTALNRTLQSDLQHCEEERDGLRRRVNKLEETLTSGSSSDQASLKRFIHESPAPSTNIKQEGEDEGDTPPLSRKSKSKVSDDSPFLRVKEHSLIGLQKRQRSPCKDATNVSGFNIMKSRNGQSKLATSSNSPGLVLASSQSSSSNRLKRPNSELQYDGLGGHSKADEFPTRLPCKIAKKPKKAASQLNQKHMNAAQKKTVGAMDKFFSKLLDTP